VNTREGDERDRDATNRHGQPDVYEIRVRGHLDGHWAAWFDALSLNRENDGTTVLRGSIADQAALHGVLQKVRDLGLELISVIRELPP